MSIRIITHAYAKKLPQYAVFLRAQLTSIIQFMPRKIGVTVTVCCATDDVRVLRVLQEFAPKLGTRLQVLAMSEGSLFRRSIGRNIAALRSIEDICWFCDVDHCFGPECLVGLWSEMRRQEGQVFAWPKWLWIHASHVLGDTFIADNLDGVGEIDLGELGIPAFASHGPSAAFEKKNYFSAIGGVQIVTGSFVREHGYLRDFPKWQQPRTDGKPFGDFRDDVKFRKFCLSKMGGATLEIPHLYRLRHTEVTYKG